MSDEEETLVLGVPQVRVSVDCDAAGDAQAVSEQGL